MPINISLLPASYGDCIFVSSDGYNILIDGGVALTYQDLRDRRNSDKPLKLFIEDLKSKDLHIDLLIVTHVDEDHIGGIKEWFEYDYPDDNFVREIWMNDDVELEDTSNLHHSPAQAGCLLDMWRKKGREYCSDIVQGVECDRGPFHIKVLAPLVKYRNSIAKKISYTLQHSGTDNGTDNITIKDLVAKPWVNNGITKENRSSIALELSTADGCKVLLLGDAHIKDVMKGLKLFYPNQSTSLQYDSIKLSHHGSKNNFNPKFLELVEAKEYLFSTNGDKFGHPDKEVIAQIVAKTNSRIGFNYRERMESLFIEQDYQDFPNLKERIFVTSWEI